MHSLNKYRRWLGLGILGLMSWSQIASAQYFTANGYGDVIAGFRKPGTGTYELVVRLGNMTNLLALTPGSTITMSNYAPSQLSDAFPGGYGSVQWSVFSSFQSSVNAWTNSFGVFPPDTVWYTLAGTNATTQTTPPSRYSHNGQALLDQKMYSVVSGAETISSGLSVTNADNNSVLVREPVADDGSGTLDDAISDTSTPSFGDFGGGTLDFTVENILPASFTSTARSDFYQSCPNSGSPTYTGHTDPITGQTTGADYFVGYFLLNTNGTMTFTRALTVTNTSPPPAPTLSIAVANSVTTISFGTTNGATYTLLYNTIAGLASPRHTWPTLGSPITGNGGVTNFTDTTVTSGRVYSVTAH
jgi:hypothetical protein